MTRSENDGLGCIVSQVKMLAQRLDQERSRFSDDGCNEQMFSF